MPLFELDKLTFELKMLTEHGVKFLGQRLRRGRFCQIQDILYFLRHMEDGIPYYRLPGICNIEANKQATFLERLVEIGFLEREKMKNCKITDDGIAYNTLWFAIQDRFNIRDRVSSTFEIYDVTRDEEAIKFLMASNFSENLSRDPCYKMPFRRGRRYSLTLYLDGFRFLAKHKRGVTKSNMISKLNYRRYYHEFMNVAITRGHIEFNEERRSPAGEPYIKATEEGLLLLSGTNWLVKKGGLGDYVPSAVG